MSTGTVQVPLSLVTTGPCEWPVLYPDGVCSALEGLSDDDRAAIESMAVDLLWLWTGRRLGLCTTVLRPCACGAERNRNRPSTWAGRGPRVRIGHWGVWEGCGCGPECRCGPGGVVLPGPVVSVTTVTVDGTVLPDDAWRVTGDVLSRTDGERWSLCQDTSLPATEEDTWEVVYSRGLVVPRAGQLAAGLLACQLAMALADDDECSLPKRLQSVTRQGVTVTIMDQFADLESGRTGIWAIDSWISAMQKPLEGGSVASPDAPRARSGRYGW